MFYVCRFTAESEVDLEKPLAALGITDMFSEGEADFRHLSEWKRSQSKPKSATEYLQQVYLDRRKASTYKSIVCCLKHALLCLLTSVKNRIILVLFFSQEAPIEVL